MINMLAEHCMLKKGASREMPHGSSMFTLVSKDAY